MASVKTVSWFGACALVALLCGCAAGPLSNGEAPGSPPHEGPPPPPQGAPPPSMEGLVIGGSDSVSATPGAPTALYRYRFAQVAPSSERFVFQDRELSFYFRPSPTVLYMQVENRQNRPVWIEWDRSVFHDPRDNSGPIAHATTRWADRFGVQAATQITGLQRYSDYVLPLDYLVDPAGTDQQLHRPLLPEDTTAPMYSDKEFGVDLLFRVEDQPRTYSFRFKVVSVIPK